MSKVCSLAEAVSTITPGSHVTLPGFAITRCAMAFAAEVVRQKTDHLTISQCVGAMDADLLVGAGMVERLIYGGGSLDRFGRLENVNRGIEDGSLIAEEYSSLSVAFRYLAGALGIPFIPIRSLRGSDLYQQLEEKHPEDIANVDDPFTGKNWLVLKPLHPDVAIVAAQIADEEGNARILGPKWDNSEQVKASKRAIVITEHLVPTEFMRQKPEDTIIPGFMVSHVVEQPFGSYPTSMYREYDYDGKQIEKYVEAQATHDSFRKYLDEYVLSTGDHWKLLEKVGGSKKLNELRADPILGY
jgi:acyl CoA:acetate/3-ketoacid CoA transferase alpha subunit